MHNTIIDNIFNLKNKNIVTPYNLLTNLKKDNYEYVNYSKEEEMILCDIGFFEEGELIKFIYLFNNDFKLESITYTTHTGEKTEVFNRSKELETALFHYDTLIKKNKVI